MKTHVAMAVLLCLLCNISLVRGDQTTNDVQIQETIVAIQKRIVDLTDSLQPFYDGQFVTIRKSMTEKTARQIVGLVRHGKLTTTQADIGVLLLSGLKEQTYWVITEPLLTTNIEAEVLDSVLDPPFPYGPGYANTYKINWYKERLLQLKAERPDSCFDLILDGEDAKDYVDYLKHPDAYGY